MKERTRGGATGGRHAGGTGVGAQRGVGRTDSKDRRRVGLESNDVNKSIKKGGEKKMLPRRYKIMAEDETRR